MKTDFKENFESDKLDPLDGKHVDFDHGEIDRRLGWVEAVNAVGALSDADYERLGTVVGELVRFVIRERKAGKHTFEMIGRRFVGLAWSIRPDFFEGSPSLSELARRTKLGKVQLSMHAADARREFGVHNRAQSHGSNFKPKEQTPVDDHECEVCKNAPCICDEGDQE